MADGILMVNIIAHFILFILYTIIIPVIFYTEMKFLISSYII